MRRAGSALNNYSLRRLRPISLPYRVLYEQTVLLPNLPIPVICYSETAGAPSDLQALLATHIDTQGTDMARIIGGIGTSHVPTIGAAYDNEKQNDPAWAPLFKGYEPVAEWLAEKQPDVMVMFYNDHA